jgi:hypothetical protein
MTGSTVRRAFLLAASLGATSLAFAQRGLLAPERIVPGEELSVLPGLDWTVVIPLIALGFLLPIAVVAIINYNEHRQNRERLATIERLVTAGHTVPAEIMHSGASRLTLADEYRRDVRRSITLLCWALGVALVLYLTSGGQLRSAAWGLLFLILSLGSFLKAWLTAREMARSASDDAR